MRQSEAPCGPLAHRGRRRGRGGARAGTASARISRRDGVVEGAWGAASFAATRSPFRGTGKWKTRRRFTLDRRLVTRSGDVSSLAVRVRWGGVALRAAGG